MNPEKIFEQKVETQKALSLKGVSIELCKSYHTSSLSPKISES